MRDHGLRSLVDLVAKDLTPTAGRLRQALRVTLATLITLVLVMAFRLPAAVIALYFILVISRDTPLRSLRWTMTIVASICISLALTCLVVTLSENDPVIRLGSVPVVTFVAAILVYGAKNPAAGSIGGYLYCIFISYWEDNTDPALVLNRSALTILALIFALLISTIVEFLFRYRKPQQVLVQQESERLQAVLAVYDGFASYRPKAELLCRVQRCELLAVGGQMEMQRLLHNVARQHGNRTGEGAPFSAVYIAMLSELLDLTTAFGKRHIGNVSLSLVAICQSIAAACTQLMHGESSEIERGEHNHSDVGQIEFLLRQMHLERFVQCNNNGTYLVLEARDPSPFLPSGVWRDKAALGFACKVSLCATFCYVLYHAVAWPEISSCVTTVLITALSTTGAMKQRLFFRCAGVVIGGLVLGMGTIVFLFPNMDSITGLLILVGGVAFSAAWIGAGRTLGYLGLQLGFCFYTVVFRGPAPETQVQSARDALVGIAVATAVMWLIFDQIWPVRTVVAIRLRLLNLVTLVMESLKMTKMAGSDRNLLDSMRVVRYRSGQDLAMIRTLNEMTRFDFGASRENLIREANALQGLALEVSGIGWDELSLTYGQAQGTREPNKMHQFADTYLPVVLNLQSRLQHSGWQVGLALGRIDELYRDERNAKRAAEALDEFQATRVQSESI